MSIEGASGGDRVSYEDMANPRRYGVVVEVTDDPWSTFRIEWDGGDVIVTDGRQHGWKIEDRTQTFTCRDIGYGVEHGEVWLPASGERDWTGKRAYHRVDGETVYLFDDELDVA